jgi:nitrous oxide reductase
MSTQPVSPLDAPPGAKPRREPRKTRRRFLKALTVLSAAAGAAGLGRAVTDAYKA